MKSHTFVLAMLSCLLTIVGCGRVEIRGKQKLDVQLADLQKLGRSYNRLTNENAITENLKQLGFSKVVCLPASKGTFRVSNKGNDYLFGIEVQPDNHTIVACSASPVAKAATAEGISTYVIAMPAGAYAIVRTALPPVPGCLFRADASGQLVELIYPDSAVDRFASIYPDYVNVLKAQSNRVKTTQRGR